MRILIADDHALFRGGLKLQLSAFSDDLDVIEAGSFAEVLQLAEQAPAADLAILDLAMPGPSWHEAVKTLKQAWPTTRVVVLTGDDDPATVRAAVDLGVHGYVPKSEQPHVFAAALRLILAGGSYFPVSMLGRADAPSPCAPATPHAITGRQREVLRLMAEGCANKEIAYRLGLTEGTVKLHVAAVLRGLGAHNRTQAVAIARESRLLA